MYVQIVGLQYVSINRWNVLIKVLFIFINIYNSFLDHVFFKENFCQYVVLLK